MSDYTCEHGKMAMGRYCEKCQAARDAEKLRAKVNAPVQTASGGLSGEALQMLNFALDHLGADVEHGGGEAAWKEKIISDMASARVELAALPLRNSGTV